MIDAADLVPDGRKGSFIGVRRAARQEPLGIDGEPPPTNEAVAQAVQEKVAVCFRPFPFACSCHYCYSEPSKNGALMSGQAAPARTLAAAQMQYNHAAYMTLHR